MTVGEKIVFERKRLGLSQTELGKRAGLAQGVLSRIEDGSTTNPQMTTLLRVADALGLTVEELGAPKSKRAQRVGDFTPRFAYCRKATGHSQSDAARRLGIRSATLAMYEGLVQIPPAWMVLKMAKLYGVPADFLLGREQDTYRGRFCVAAYCEAGLLHDHCCLDCEDREGCAEACENRPERCGVCRTKRPHEMFKKGETG